MLPATEAEQNSDSVAVTQSQRLSFTPENALEFCKGSGLLVSGVALATVLPPFFCGITWLEPVATWMQLHPQNASIICGAIAHYVRELLHKDR